MDKKQELESHIKFAKENRDYFANKINAYEKELKELEQLTRFKRSIEIESVVVYNETKCQESYPLYFKGAANYDYDFKKAISIKNKLDSTLAMLDLAEWCNEQFEYESNLYELYFSGHTKTVNYGIRNDRNSSVAGFYSKGAILLAISEIKKSEELTKLAKIFLGVQE